MVQILTVAGTFKRGDNIAHREPRSGDPDAMVFQLPQASEGSKVVRPDRGDTLQRRRLDNERMVDVLVGRLRKRLSRAQERDPIRTMRNVGYAFDETFGKGESAGRVGRLLMARHVAGEDWEIIGSAGQGASWVTVAKGRESDSSRGDSCRRALCLLKLS
jgi:hypothetical protein